MNWGKRHSGWTQFSRNGTCLILVVAFLSIAMSCVAPVVVDDNKSTINQPPSFVDDRTSIEPPPLIDDSGVYKSDNVTFYKIGGSIEHNRSATLDFSNPNQRYVTMDIPTELEDKYGVDVTFVVCAGGNGDPLLLTNNPNAKDVTWEEIIEFIRIARTDSIPYVVGSFTCGDYAKTVHDNAEKQGIRAGVVPVLMIDDRGHYINHTWNVFRILGEDSLMYIDCTNISSYADDGGWLITA